MKRLPDAWRKRRSRLLRRNEVVVGTPRQQHPGVDSVSSEARLPQRSTSSTTRVINVSGVATVAEKGTDSQGTSYVRGSFDQWGPLEKVESHGVCTSLKEGDDHGVTVVVAQTST